MLIHHPDPASLHFSSEGHLACLKCGQNRESHGGHCEKLARNKTRGTAVRKENNLTEQSNLISASAQH